MELFILMKKRSMNDNYLKRTTLGEFINFQYLVKTVVNDFLFLYKKILICKKLFF